MPRSIRILPEFPVSRKSDDRAENRDSWFRNNRKKIENWVRLSKLRVPRTILGFEIYDPIQKCGERFSTSRGLNLASILPH